MSLPGAHRTTYTSVGATVRPPTLGTPHGPDAADLLAPSLAGASASSSSGARPHRDLRLEPGTRRIVHLDVDAFLASVEQVEHPELRGKALVIGGLPTERNLVMSASYEARAFGVKPGMRLSEAARLCPRAIFRRGDSQAANRLRERVALLLRRYSPIVEVASIDDFFVDLTGTTLAGGAASAQAERMRAEVAAEVGLPLTIGIGTSRMLARLAGKLAKPGGVAEVLPGYEQAFLAHLPVEHLPGVGPTVGALLERFSIRTVGELRLVSREVLFATFGRAGLVLHTRARGLDDEPVEATYVEDEHGVLRPRPPQAIRRDNTFEPEEGRRELLEAMLSYLVERAAARLRSHRSSAGALEVRVRYVDTRPGADPHADTGEGPAEVARRRTLREPSDATDALWRHARALFELLPRRRALVKRMGITLLALRRASSWQMHMFDDAQAEPEEHARSHADRQRDLDRAVDALRARHGFGRLLRGSSLPLIDRHKLGPDGFELRTPSLNQ